jgi:hypothetical protein
MCHKNGVEDKVIAAEQEEKDMTLEELEAMEAEDEKENREIIDAIGIVMRWGENLGDQRVASVLLNDQIDCKLPIDQLWEVFYGEHGLIRLIALKQILDTDILIVDMNLRQLDLAISALEEIEGCSYGALLEEEEIAYLEIAITLLIEDRIHQECKSMDLETCGAYLKDIHDSISPHRLFSQTAQMAVMTEHENKFFKAMEQIQSFDDCIALKKHMIEGSLEERWMVYCIYNYYPEEALKKAEEIKESIHC